QVNVKYELMPRGQYTLNVPPQQLHSLGAEEPKLSYDRYEAVLELYQAENAIAIAKSQGADQYASDSLAKAKALLVQAQDLNARKSDPHAIVSAAREAAQMAEDARTIAVKRQAEERKSEEAQRSAEKSELLQRREQETAREQAQAQAAQAQADEAAEAARIQQARAQAAEAQARATQHAVLTPPPPPPQRQITATRDSERHLRAQLLSQLNGSFPTLDTPRGLVITLAGDGLRDENARRLAAVASIVASHPGLQIRVEGYADTQPLSSEHAQAVRKALVARGAPPSAVTAIGYGDSRPLASNATAAGRERNRRVEVVIYGPSIGQRALWDRPYSLQSQ